MKGELRKMARKQWEVRRRLGLVNTAGREPLGNL